MSEATIARPQELLPEDQARAEFYALLARLFGDAPDVALLSAIASAPALEPARGLEPAEAKGVAPAWNAVRDATPAPSPTSQRFATNFRRFSSASGGAK